jgi:3D (Asp-Asp-Asp) domain-containing protein
MKRLITTAGLVLSFACQLFASDHIAVARVTVYWHAEGSGRAAAWNGARLREGNCAVDPKKIPYGSKVIFGDGECMATDTGPAVVKRKAARSSGRTAAERNAIVIDRFFESKERAIAWERAHPHFTTVRVLTAESKQGTN